MKISVKLILLLFLIAVSLSSLLAQKSQRQSNVPEIAKPFDINQYKDWQKIDFNELSLYLPKDFKIEKRRGIDMSFWEYKTESVNIKIYSGSRLPERSSVEEDFSTYKERHLFVNNIFTNTWSYEYEVKDYPYKFINLARYYSDREDFTKGLVISIGAKNESKELAEKIFHSVKLNNISITKLSK